jgi:hypothetical protein
VISVTILVKDIYYEAPLAKLFNFLFLYFHFNSMRNLSVKIFVFVCFVYKGACLVGIPKGCKMDSWGSIPGSVKGFLSSPHSPNPLWGPPVSYPMDIVASSPRNKAVRT